MFPHLTLIKYTHTHTHTHTHSTSVDHVNTTQQLTDLQKNHSVLFLLVHDEEIDADWHSVYTRIASEKALDAKFAYTTEPDVVKVTIFLQRPEIVVITHCVYLVQDHGINTLPCIMVLKDGKAFIYRGTQLVKKKLIMQRTSTE